MRLFVRELGGDGPALVVLHGLYGSSRNWATAGKLLAARFRVVALDLRNHCESPHAPEMSYPLLAADVVLEDSYGARGLRISVRFPALEKGS